MVDKIDPQTLASMTLTEALDIRNNGQVIPFAGGTDLMVRRRSWAGTLPRFETPVVFIGKIPELIEISTGGGQLTIGAAATLAAINSHPAVPQILKRAIVEMASPAIRNMGTLGGNICNASPAADTLPPLYALEATVVLQSKSDKRELPISEFITGPGQTVLQSDELMVAIKIPFAEFNKVYYKKVGTRKADALSKVSFAGLARVNGGIIEDVRLAIGAVAPRVVRNPEAEALLKGKQVNGLADMVEEIKKHYLKDIRPIDDQRSNAKYRKLVSLRLVEDFVKNLL